MIIFVNININHFQLIDMYLFIEHTWLEHLV